MLKQNKSSDRIHSETKPSNSAFKKKIKQKLLNEFNDNKSNESNISIAKKVLNTNNSIEQKNLEKLSLNNTQSSLYASKEKRFDKNENTILYNSILSNLDSLLSKCDPKKLNFYLQKIFDYVNLIVTEINQQNSQFLTTESSFLDVKKNIETFNNYQKNISILTEKITDLENELLLLKSEENIKISEKKQIRFLNKKLNDLAKKHQMNELNYLLCIGDQNQKMKKLEKEYNMKSIEEMDKNELSKAVCYPRIIKFNENMTINPKITPLHLINKFSKSQKQNENTEKISKKKTKKKSYFMTDCLTHTKKFINTETNTDKEVINEKINKGKQIIKNLSSFDSKFLKNKNYLISHPKLEFPYFIYNDGNFNIRSKNDQYKKFTMNLFRLKFNSTLRKNPNIVIPSILGEAEVNIEKLRVFKNFDHLEYLFNEKNKNRNIKKKTAS